jgi:hypothetical protein
MARSKQPVPIDERVAVPSRNEAAEKKGGADGPDKGENSDNASADSDSTWGQGSASALQLLRKMEQRRAKNTLADERPSAD